MSEQEDVLDKAIRESGVALWMGYCDFKQQNAILREKLEIATSALELLALGENTSNLFAKDTLRLLK